MHEDEESVTSPVINLTSEVGESLMIRRKFPKVTIPEEPLQRKALFQINCTVQGKVCKIVVDSGSTENMVSCEMVNKLNLKRIPYDFPYKVSWLSNVQSLIVNEQAMVDFKIGEYKDSVLCDILPMDCCHLLRGIPWKFDRNSLYDGRNNTY